MKQQEFKSLIEKTGDYDVKKCDWCNIWKPQRDVVKEKIFGTEMCTNCWYNFHKIATKIEHAEVMIDWLIRNLLKQGIVVEINMNNHINGSDSSASGTGLPSSLPGKPDR